jgi:hypothetical protein
MLNLPRHSPLFARLTQTHFADSLVVYRILKGNLAPGGAVAKITGKEGLEFTGRARTFDTEDAFVEAVEKGEIKKGEKTVAVLRYLGPKGGPGESDSRDFSFSTSRLLFDWGLGMEVRGFLGVYDANVSLHPIPFPDSLAGSVISVLRRPFFLFSLPGFPLLSLNRTSASLLCYLSYLADGDGHGVASINGASLFCWKPSWFSVLWFCDAKPKVTRECGSPWRQRTPLP